MSLFSPHWRIAMHYGALSGLGSFLVFLILYFKGINPMGPYSWLGAWIPVVFICLAMRHYRSAWLQGWMTYGQGFRTGMLTVLFSALLFESLVYIFGYFTQASFLPLYIQEALQTLEHTQMFYSSSLYEMMEQEIENLALTKLLVNDFFNKLLGGLLVSLFAAAFYRKLPNSKI